MTKLKKSNGDQTQKLKLWQNLKYEKSQFLREKKRRRKNFQKLSKFISRSFIQILFQFLGPAQSIQTEPGTSLCSCSWLVLAWHQKSSLKPEAPGHSARAKGRDAGFNWLSGALILVVHPEAKSILHVITKIEDLTFQSDKDCKSLSFVMSQNYMKDYLPSGGRTRMTRPSKPHSQLLQTIPN